jgi:hypothetical protein
VEEGATAVNRRLTLAWRRIYRAEQDYGVINIAPCRRRARVGDAILLAILMFSCREAPAQGTIDASTARSYSAGRSQEIDFISAALGMLACAKTADQRRVVLAGATPEHGEIAAAAVLAMRVADYRALVRRVDSVLRVSRDLDSRTRRLDSLRVELTVLQTRMSAGGASLPAPTLAGQSSSSSKPCDEQAPPPASPSP